MTNQPTNFMLELIIGQLERHDQRLSKLELPTPLAPDSPAKNRVGRYFRTRNHGAVVKVVQDPSVTRTFYDPDVVDVQIVCDGGFLGPNGYTLVRCAGADLIAEVQRVTKTVWEPVNK